MKLFFYPYIYCPIVHGIDSVHRFIDHLEFGAKDMEFTDVYIKNFGENYCEEQLKRVFSAFGKKSYLVVPI